MTEQAQQFTLLLGHVATLTRPEGIQVAPADNRIGVLGPTGGPRGTAERRWA